MTSILAQIETWTALALGVMIILILKPIQKSLLPHLDLRRQAIAQMIAEARVLHDEAVDMANDARTKLENADNQAAQMMADIKAAIIEEKKRAQIETASTIANHKQAAVERLNRVTYQAKLQVRDALTRQSLERLGFLLDQSLDAKRHSTLIKTAIAHSVKSSFL